MKLNFMHILADLGFVEYPLYIGTRKTNMPKPPPQPQILTATIHHQPPITPTTTTITTRTQFHSNHINTIHHNHTSSHRPPYQFQQQYQPPPFYPPQNPIYPYYPPNTGFYHYPPPNPTPQAYQQQIYTPPPSQPTPPLPSLPPKPTTPSPPPQQYHNNNSEPYIHTPSLELPLFFGENAQGWLDECESIFALAGIATETKIKWANAHVRGKAKT